MRLLLLLLHFSSNGSKGSAPNSEDQRQGDRVVEAGSFGSGGKTQRRCVGRDVVVIF
jgi:hypothetical protein